MKVIGFPGDSNESIGSAVATIGVFDGIHIGHRALLTSVVERAKLQDAKAVIITFDPHPQTVLGIMTKPVKQLTSLSERLNKFAEFGFDIAIVCRFTRELSLISGEQFLRVLIGRFGLRDFLLGPNHTFGYQRSANRETLPGIAKTLEINIDWIAATELNGLKVSSSSIRNLLDEGRLEEANSLLGCPYHIGGIVVTGDQRGRELGIPTANVQIEPIDKLIPADGVYFAMTTDDASVPNRSVVSVGKRPTFGDLPRLVEVHLLDFSGNLYGHRLQIDLLKYWRPQVAFSTVPELIEKIQSDITDANKFFNKSKKDK